MGLFSGRNLLVNRIRKKAGNRRTEAAGFAGCEASLDCATRRGTVALFALLLRRRVRKANLQRMLDLKNTLLNQITRV